MNIVILCLFEGLATCLSVAQPPHRSLTLAGKAAHGLSQQTHASTRAFLVNYTLHC